MDHYGMPSILQDVTNVSLRYQFSAIPSSILSLTSHCKKRGVCVSRGGGVFILGKMRLGDSHFLRMGQQNFAGITGNHK